MSAAALGMDIAKRDEIIRRQAPEIAELKKRAASLEQQLVELKSLLKERAATKDAKRPIFSQDYSLSRQERERVRHRRGRGRPADGLARRSSTASSGPTTFIRMGASSARRASLCWSPAASLPKPERWRPAP